MSSDWSVLTKTFAVVLEECKLLYSYSCKKKKLKVDLSWELHFLDFFFFPPYFLGGGRGRVAFLSVLDISKLCCLTVAGEWHL